MIIFTLSSKEIFKMLTDLNQMYSYGWSSIGSSKKIVKQCINIVINTI